MKNLIKAVNKKVFIFSFIMWTVINVSDIQNIYFFNWKIITVPIVKILHLLFIYFLSYKVYNLYENRRTKKGKSEIIITSIYFLILIFMLMLTWPGLWSWDDIGIVANASNYDLSPWQHFFSGLFQTLCLQTIPIASGVIIIQILVSSLIVGYSISNISMLYGKSKKQTIILQVILMLIMLFPPLISYILSGFRMGIYTYFELFVIVKLLIIYKQNRRVTLNELLTIVFFTIIISCWRTEGFYYPFLIFIIFLILGKKIISKKLALAMLMLMILFNYSIGKLNNNMIGTNNYSITATMEPVTALVKIADSTDEEQIKAINKVIDVQVILDMPAHNGETYYWMRNSKRLFTRRV